MRFLPALLCALALATPVAAQTVLIRDGRVVTNSGAGTIENGDVLIVDGRIRAVGANITAPNGARVIEAQGQLRSSPRTRPASRSGLALRSHVRRSGR